MQERSRAMLWQLHAELGPLASAEWPAALAARAAAAGCAWQWHPELDAEPATAAVRVAHALGMGPAGLQAWPALWASDDAALQVAVAAAPLLAGRGELQLLVAPAGRGMAGAGAWVDGESCARMAVAGYDPEIELQLGNCAGLLASSGDLRPLVAFCASLTAGRRFLVLGMKGDATAGH
jgi:hypothetical protein